MPRLRTLALATLTALMGPLAGAQGILKPVEGRLILFNGEDLSGWVGFLPDSGVSPDENWQIRENGVLHCVGQGDGYLRTEHTYANYRLTLEWRWPREAGECGVLLHVQDEDSVWPQSLEAALTAGHAGDVWANRATFDEREDSGQLRTAKREASSENPPGEWNKLEVVSTEDTVEVFVNGVLQNRATQASVERGHIALQSVGTPIEFRNIMLHPVEPPTPRKDASGDKEDEEQSARNS